MKPQAITLTGTEMANRHRDLMLRRQAKWEESEQRKATYPKLEIAPPRFAIGDRVSVHSDDEDNEPVILTVDKVYCEVRAEDGNLKQQEWMCWVVDESGETAGFFSEEHLYFAV